VASELTSVKPAPVQYRVGLQQFHPMSPSFAFSFFS
jgi:hypothetical protein